MQAKQMRLLFEMDKKDYAHCTHAFTRNSARSIIIRDGKVAMIHSLKYDYYKFPGGGIEKGEDPEDYAFIQSSVFDNRALLRSDPDYVKQLEALPVQ